MRIIDSHNHVYYHQLDPAGVVAELDEFGIERCWVLTWYLPPAEDVPASHGNFNPRNFRADGTHGGSTLDDVIEACRVYPDRFYGVSICGEWSYRMLLDDPRALELFHKAGELKMPVVLHLDVPFLPTVDGGRSYQTNWYGGGAEPLERTLRECADTVFVGHAPGFWRFLSGDEATETATYPQGPITPGGEVVRLLETYPNLWADLSARSGLGAMQRDQAHGRRFIEAYQDRLLFGRDAPGDALRTWLLGLDLEEAVLRKLFHKNAERLVPLRSGD